MLKNKETLTFSRDQHNQRINNLENTNYTLFSNQINLVARPETDICNKRFRDKIYQPLSRNTPLIIQPRPINSHCEQAKSTYHDSQSKRDLSYCQVFNEPLRDDNDITRPYRDMVWNQVTKRRMTESDCHGNL